MARAPFAIGERQVPAGGREIVDLPFSVLSNYTPMELPVQVVHGRRDGPTIFVSAAVHGNEILGVEIIRRLLRTKALQRLRGTLLAVPIVNAYGFLSHTRYLPDRRDLNRSFPGSPRGSLAALLAHLFTTEVVRRSDYGIDLHSAASHRVNLPQIRFNAAVPGERALAEAFGAPVILNSGLRDGSLRKVGAELGVPILVYEAGEALRFDELSVRAGVRGILNVMRHLEMLPGRRGSRARFRPLLSQYSSWLRAPAGGLLRTFRTIGDSVVEGEVIGAISDPFGETETAVECLLSGLIIGRSNLPVINQGDALFHIAEVARPEAATEQLDQLESELVADPLFDEDEII